MEYERPSCILLVDRDGTFRSDFIRLLGPLVDDQIRGCGSTENAKAILLQEEFDLIMLDQGTLASSEGDFYEWMRENGIETPVVVLVPGEEESTARDVLRPGVYDYIRKDQIVGSHLPIMIKGIRERYLLRKYMEQRARDEEGAARRRRMIEGLRKSAEAISYSIANDLSILLAESEEYAEIFKKTKVGSGHLDGRSLKDGRSMTDASEAFSRFHREVEVVAAGIKSLMTFSNMLMSRMDDRMGGLHSESGVDSPLQATRQEIEEQNRARDLSAHGI